MTARQRNGEKRELSVSLCFWNRHKGKEDVSVHAHAHCVKSFNGMSILSGHCGLCFCPVRVCLHSPLCLCLMSTAIFSL